MIYLFSDNYLDRKLFKIEADSEDFQKTNTP
jgi:hypothetical protein